MSKVFTISILALIGVALWLGVGAVQNPLVGYSQRTNSVTRPQFVPTAERKLVNQADRSELDLAIGDAATLMITDAQGRRTGREPSSGTRFEEIPNSVYFEDAVEASSGKQVNRFIQINRPEVGVYLIKVKGQKTGDYLLSIRAFSMNGASQPQLRDSGRLMSGDEASFELHYTSVIGQSSSLVKVKN